MRRPRRPPGPRACAPAPAPPSGWGWRRCSAGRRPTGSPRADRPAGRRRAGSRRSRSAPRRRRAPARAGRRAPGSEVSPVTDTGRVWGTSASSAPSVTTSWVPSASASSITSFAERPPAKRGLAAGQQDQVARRARHPRLVELDRGPDDLARLPVDHLDPRTGGLEVVELLGVDRREPARAQGRADELDRARGRVGGVVPALERADQRRGA